MKEIEKTPFYSKKIGNLPRGCQLCVKGEKLVLYITGVCPRKCWYCPLSEKRKDKDVVFVNEWETNNIDDLLQEIRLCQSKGAGITGGDPLSRLNRTLEYIKIMKKEFGKKFHIHLYTSFDLINENNLEQLYEVGLDEIRFHANFEKKELWEKIDLVNKYNWDVGIEIPAIPHYEDKIIEMCDFFNDKIKFLNLNEFEISDLNSEEMGRQGYVMKSDISHGIKGSEKTAEKILKHVQENGLDFNVHYCSSKLKDRVQMQNRFKLRAEKVKTKFDIVTDEGMLIKGVIYLKNQEKNLEKLNKMKRMLEDEGLELEVDGKKFRLITYPEHVEQFAQVLKKNFDLVPAIIEEDPTVEAFEVNKNYL